MTNLTQASRQLFTRAPDERYASLPDLLRATVDMKQRCVSGEPVCASLFENVSGDSKRHSYLLEATKKFWQKLPVHHPNRGRPG